MHGGYRTQGLEKITFAFYIHRDEMPMGPFVCRKLDNDFKSEKRDKYVKAYHYIDYLILTNNLHIQHKLNWET